MRACKGYDSLFIESMYEQVASLISQLVSPHVGDASQREAEKKLLRLSEEDSSNFLLSLLQIGKLKEMDGII